jgi:ABC-type multidrug transport system ATPase subunit
MSESAIKLLGNSTYLIYKKTIYYEAFTILENKKEFIRFDSVPNGDKKKRVSEICDFLYLEKDRENFKKMDNILKILQIKEKISPD